MVSQGRAFAIACGWIVLTLSSLASLLILLFWHPGADPRENDGVIVLFVLVWTAILLPVALIGAGMWVARKQDNAQTTAGLAVQAAAIGLAAAFVATAGYLCLQTALGLTLS